MKVFPARTLGVAAGMAVLVFGLAIGLRPAPGNGADQPARSISPEDRRLIEDVVCRFLRAQADADFAGMYEMLAPDQRAAARSCSASSAPTCRRRTWIDSDRPNGRLLERMTLVEVYFVVKDLR